MRSFHLLAAAVLVGSAMAEIKKIGCYSSIPTSAKMHNNTVENSMGFCGTITCKDNVAFATSARDFCYCLDEIPPASDKLGMDKCNLSCPGFPADNCGGASAYMFYDNGVALSIPTASPVSSTTSTAPSSTATSAPTTTRASSTPSPTATSKPSATGEPASKPNTAGIAAGVVIGVVVIAGALGGLWFFMKQRKKRALEEEHRRNAEANANKPSHNPFNDTRLDAAALAQRRMSDGSIADNQDYSRRILKVTNA